MQLARILVATALIAACGKSNTAVDVDASGTGKDAAPSPDAPSGANTITGMVGGKPFNTVMSTYWIGKPDSPTTDTVIYLFDKTVRCDQIVNAGWDTNPAIAGTQSLELKMVGKAPKAYPNTTQANHIPLAGESLSAYTVAASTAGDVIATGGSVTLTMIAAEAPGNFASGTFHVTFPNSGVLDGTYTSAFCMLGREP